MDLTKGNIWKTLISFSLPFLLSYFLQTLYGLADLFIIGQFEAASSTTAVAIGSQIMHMITVILVGLAMGATVLIGQAIGAGEKKKTADTIANTIILFAIISVVLVIVLISCNTLILDLLSTPKEAWSSCQAYLLICFAGIPMISGYNIASSIYRGLGDSKSPMIFVAIACAINVALDYLFIGSFHMGAAGAAYATVIAQSISMLIAFYVLFRFKNLAISKQSFHLKKEIVVPLMKVGVPVAFQDGFIQVSFLIITLIANLRGLNESAAVGIVEKIIGILFLVPSSMLASVSALAAINIGARQFSRAREILRDAIILCVGFGLTASVIVLFAAEWIVALFTREPLVITMGAQYLSGYVFDCVLAGIHFSLAGYFTAWGYSMLPFISNVISIVIARIPLAWFASILFQSLMPMGLSITTGSLVSAIVSGAFYFWLTNKQKKEGYRELA